MWQSFRKKLEPDGCNEDLQQATSRPYPVIVALIIVLMAALVRLTLLRGFEGYAFITFFPAVTLAILYGGVRAGIIATLASALAADYFWLQPDGSLILTQRTDWLAVAIFVTSNLLVTFIAGQLQCAQLELRRMERRRAHELEREVARRTAALSMEIAEKQRAEANLLRATAILRGIGQNSPDPIYAKDTEGRFLYANPAVLEVIGKSAEEVLGRTDADWHSNAEQAATVMANDRRIMRSRLPEVIEETWDAADRGRRTFRSAKAPLILDDGSLAGIVAVSSDLTERKALEGELRAAKAEAERSVLARSKFLASASHDLRQPVQSMILLFAVLKRDSMTPMAAKAVRIMEQSLNSLTMLLNRILDISRLDAGIVTPQSQIIDLEKVLGRLSQEYALRAEQKGLRFKVKLRPLRTLADPALLESALRNLMENAIKYTEVGGVLIGLRCHGGRVRIDVFDTGMGIPGDKQPHIFEEFYQVGNPGRERGKGLGLGLSIVERIARLLDAEVKVLSTEGRGSCFSLLMPMRDDDEPVLASDLSEELGLGQYRILIIEDELEVRGGLELLLKNWGYETITAASGEEALDLGAAEGWRFDAVITDHRLGAGLSGTATAKAICNRAGRPLPTIVITGDTAPERIVEIHVSGFEVLHKPVGAKQIRLKLARLFHGSVRGR